MIFGILILVLFIVLGIVVGQNIVIPYSSYQYVAVAILACLDSVFGALAASTDKNFKMKIFLSGFFFNAIFAMFLVSLIQTHIRFLPKTASCVVGRKLKTR